MTRRDAFRAAMGAALLLRTRLGCAKASQPATSVNFDVPPKACDCHTHIFGDPLRFPLWPGRTYTPETASPRKCGPASRASIGARRHRERRVSMEPIILRHFSESKRVARAPVAWP